MGYQVGDACYPTATDAARAAASREVGTLVPHGSTSYVINASSADDTSITYVLTPVGGGTAITVTAPYTAQQCGLLEFGDGLEMGWLIVAAWVGVYGIKALAIALNGWGDQSGNT